MLIPPPHQDWGGRAVVGVLLAGALLIGTLAATTHGTRLVSGHALPASGVDLTRGGTSSEKGTDGRPAPKESSQLASNPLLADGVTLTEVTCSLPALGRAPEQLAAFYKAEVDCLAEAWKPALDKANEPALSATVQVTLPDHSACGKPPSKDEAVAYYCGGDTTIYAPTEWMLDDAGQERARHLATIAHEYGHHVQRESGILSASADKMTSDDESSPADQELVRRIELQANCFGAVFIAAAAGRGAISTSLANATVADYGRADDSDTHGSRKHQLKWAKAGFAGKSPSACNTWAASAADVT
ncbi:neutral zinc metallopeptidase [Amycolatopsis sp. H20-H5]|nr:neutral zinc metallopeptidase [Amycolatopsis sp. H20-H5]MEC3973978.1 neutral zinc metallopeptidase [Amycolatopsis sp. H20-H5]